MYLHIYADDIGWVWHTAMHAYTCTCILTIVLEDESGPRGRCVLHETHQTSKSNATCMTHGYSDMRGNANMLTIRVWEPFLYGLGRKGYALLYRTLCMMVSERSKEACSPPMAASRSGRPVLVKILLLKTDGLVPGGPAIREIWGWNKHRKSKKNMEMYVKFWLSVMGVLRIAVYLTGLTWCPRMQGRGPSWRRTFAAKIRTTQFFLANTNSDSDFCTRPVLKQVSQRLTRCAARQTHFVSNKVLILYRRQCFHAHFGFDCMVLPCTRQFRTVNCLGSVWANLFRARTSRNMQHANKTVLAFVLWAFHEQVHVLWRITSPKLQQLMQQAALDLSNSLICATRFSRPHLETTHTVISSKSDATDTVLSGLFFWHSQNVQHHPTDVRNAGRCALI